MLLKQLLIQSRDFAAKYEDALSNHLPMTLYALNRIGASEDQLKSFYASYIPQLAPQTNDSIKIGRDNWKNYLGQHQHNSSYRIFFEHEFSSRGQKETLSTYLPELFPGVSGGAFHPLIRLAYGLEFHNVWEMAEALASWCMAYQELGPINQNRSNRPIDPLVTIQSLCSQYEIQPLQIQGENIFHRIKNASETDFFKKNFQNLNFIELNTANVSLAALKIYESSRDNFTALHFVTASHAFRIIAGHLENSSRELAFLFQGICAAYLTIKCPKVESSNPIASKLPSWNEILEKARVSTKDHVIKLTYTAHQEFDFYKNYEYQLIAAKKVGLLPK